MGKLKAAPESTQFSSMHNVAPVGEHNIGGKGRGMEKWDMAPWPWVTRKCYTKNPEAPALAGMEGREEMP